MTPEERAVLVAARLFAVAEARAIKAAAERKGSAMQRRIAADKAMQALLAASRRLP